MFVTETLQELTEFFKTPSLTLAEVLKTSTKLLIY